MVSLPASARLSRWAWLAGTILGCGAPPQRPAVGHREVGVPVTLKGPKVPPASLEEEVRCLGDPDRRVRYGSECHSVEDCRMVWVPIDCCGSSRAVGVRRREEPRLSRELAECPGRASCECLAEPTVLDSGERASGPEDITLACEDGRCRTRLSPAARKARGM